jgi:hypothetical protein
MNRLNLPLVMAIALVASPVQAKSSCPPREKGSHPWGVDEIMPGDKWAWVHLTIDTDGQPVGCGIGENNMTQGMRSLVCRSYIHNWVATPVIQDGKPVRATIKRYFVAMGLKHEEAELKARKQYFREHPEERPECYQD